MMKTKTVAGFSVVVAIVVAVLASLAGACQKKEDANARGAGAVSKKPGEPVDPFVDSRSQYDLTAAISEAEAMPVEEAEKRYGKIRADYQGKRFHWRVHRIPGLCPGTERCNVMAFDFTDRAEKQIVQGWMPSLALDGPAVAALDKRCPASERCTFEFEGTLDRLVLSTEHLTSLHFSDVRIP